MEPQVRGRSACNDKWRRPSYHSRATLRVASATRGGWGRRRYLDTANGSLAEVETALGIARELEFLQPAEFGRLEALATETGKTLFGLLRKITASATRSPPP